MSHSPFSRSLPPRLVRNRGEVSTIPLPETSILTPPHFETAGGEPLANRLRKNLRHLGKWARRAGVSCYRLYDADLPEYAAAIDRYGSWVHVQEYAPPPTVDPKLAEARLRDLCRATADVLEIADDEIVLKVRQRQRGNDQYQRQSTTGEFFEIDEGGCSFFVNLRDYLDTGLFLDHRKTRELVANEARGTRFLNLFCYTATVTCHAVRGGAVESLSIDLSNTYTDWGGRNFERNRVDPSRHTIVRDDCLAWLEREPEREFDLIFLDPPTFSNSKRMRGPFDVLRDHPDLIWGAERRLAAGGTILFSNNHRRFQIDREGLAGLDVKEITQQTLPKDFERNPRIHNSWRVTRSADA